MSYSNTNHSHSIVAEPRNMLIHRDIPSQQVHNTVRNTVKRFCLLPIARDRCRRKLLGAAGVLEENSIAVPHTQKDSATLARELLIQIVVEPFVRPPG
jgi:hypothetical protein